MIGQTISHYRITRQLGAGGMGVVYEAEDTKLKRTVALKFLPPESTRDPEAKARFIHEAQAASALDHPNVCTIYEFDETDDGQLFLAMARYEGETLKDRIARSPLSIEETLDITRQIAEGLARAHKRDIVHRDIKPANIFVTEDRLVKILDFGLAKLAGQTQITQTGTTLGTVAYMSPEQAMGGDVDHRTDLWSLGAICYEMITGHPPFKGDFPQSLIYAILNHDPESPCSINPDVPDSLEKVVVTGLQKEADNRYSQAEAILDDLGFASGSSPDLARKGPGFFGNTTRTGIRSTKFIVTVGLVLLMLALGVIGIRSLIKRTDVDYPAKVLAVIPFTAIGMGEDAYFAEGISDEILNRLSYLDGLNVISQHTSRQLKESGDGILVAGRSLGLSHLLEGSVQRETNEGRVESFLVRSRLVRVDDGVVLWSDSFAEPEQEIFHVQAQVAEAVARKLDLVLLAADRQSLEARPTENIEAYRHYLKGQDMTADNLGLDGLRQRRLDLLEAVKLDTSFVEAYAALAGLEVWLYRNWGKEEGLSLAEAAVARAVELDPENMATKSAQAGLAYNGFRDFEAALEYLEEVIKAQPSNAGAWHGIGKIQRRKGQWDQALTSLETAQKLDPLDTGILSLMGTIQFWMRQFADGLQTIDRIQTIDLDLRAPQSETKALMQAGLDGNLERAGETMRQALKNIPPQGWQHGIVGVRVQLIRLFPEIYSKVFANLDLASANTRVTMEAARFRAELAWATGDKELEKALADTMILVCGSGDFEDSGLIPYFLAMAYSHLGMREEFLRERERMLDPIPPERFAYLGMALLGQLAEAAVRVGAVDLALQDLELLFSVPSRHHPGIVRQDPLWLTLADYPGFMELVEANINIRQHR